ncbi:MAG: PA0069 family radical SAM protein [Gammaproteobacteria bacterium]
MKTELRPDPSRTVLTWNRSPDVPFDRSLNPYRGCEHGCIYCYARPTHAWLDLSPGLDFETRLFYKPDAADLLRKALSQPGYRCDLLGLGTNTDAYQPAERRLGITRRVLQLLNECRHPVGVITKSSLVERDIDILREMAQDHLVQVQISVTTLRPGLSRILEPRAAAPHRRLRTIATLSEAGIPVGVLVAPVIPALTDEEVESILAAAREAGAAFAGYILLRLPHELKVMFADWLGTHFPLKAERVLNRLRDMHGGRLYDSNFATRRRGAGPYADLLERRFEVARRRLGYRAAPEYNTQRFHPPDNDSPQLKLFD